MQINPREFVFSMLLLLLATLLPSVVYGNVEVARIGPFTVQTGSWSAYLMRGTAPIRCPFGGTNDCYFVWIDVRNTSDQTLDCTSQARYDNGFFQLNNASGQRAVLPRTAYPIIVINAGARLNNHFAWNVNCTARPPTSSPPPAGDIRMEGRTGVRFSTDQRQVRVEIERIANRRSGGISGALSVQVWLTSQPNATQGHLIAELNIGTLPAGSGIAIDRTVNVSPPSGSYYVSYLLREAGRGTLDQRVFDGQVSFGSGTAPPPPPSPPPPAQAVGFVGGGGAALSADGSQLTTQIQRVANNRSNGVSDALSIQVWLTTQPGADEGFLVGTISLGTVPAGYGMSVTRTITIQPPSPGTYFVTYLLLEGTVVVDRLNVTQPVTVSGGGGGGGSGSSAGTGSSGSSGSGDGGGGSVGWGSCGALLILGLLSAFQRRRFMLRNRPRHSNESHP